MKSFLSILLLSVGLVFTSPALATDLITSRTLLEDTTGALTIADVAGHVVTPTGPSLSITSTKTVHWLCLRVRPPANGGKVVLLVRPAYINEVRLYEAGPGSPQTWKTRVTGNHYAYGTRDQLPKQRTIFASSPEAPRGSACKPWSRQRQSAGTTDAISLWCFSSRPCSACCSGQSLTIFWTGSRS